MRFWSKSGVRVVGGGGDDLLKVIADNDSLRFELLGVSIGVVELLNRVGMRSKREHDEFRR